MEPSNIVPFGHANMSRRPDVEIFRPKRDSRFTLLVRDPQPIPDVADIWTSTAQIAVVGIFVILLGAVLYFARGFLMPVLAAMVIGTTFSPLVKYAKRCGVPRGVT